MTPGKRGRAIVALACLTSASATACRDAPPGPASPGTERAVVELVGNDKADEHGVITETEYRGQLARVRLEREGTLEAAPLAPDLKDALLERMIDEHLLMAEALRKGVKVSTAAVAREVEAMRAALPPKQLERQLVETYQREPDLARAIERRLLAAELLKTEAFASIKVTDEDVKKAWDTLPAEEKVRPARVHALQIVVHTEEEGREVIRLLKKGRDFADLAREKSVAPEAARGGDLGWFEAGVVPTVFDDVCFSLKPGSVSELTASDFGYHVFKLLEAEDQVPLALEAAKKDLEAKLREERIRSAEVSYKEALRAKVRVVKNEELLAAIE